MQSIYRNVYLAHYKNIVIDFGTDLVLATHRKVDGVKDEIEVVACRGFDMEVDLYFYFRSKFFKDMKRRRDFLISMGVVNAGGFGQFYKWRWNLLREAVSLREDERNDQVLFAGKS